MIKYLKPLDLFRESMKRTYHMPSAAFLGLSLSDGYARLATTDDCYLYVNPYGCFPRDESLLDNLVSRVQRLKNNFGYDLEGIIVANNNSVVPTVNIHNFMEELCKKGKFESLKYTCWKDDIISFPVELECNQFGSLFWGMTFTLDHSRLEKRYEALSAANMLTAFLDLCRTLDKEKDKKTQDPVSDSDSDFE